MPNKNTYRWAVRPLLFRFDPEGIHTATLNLSAALGRSALVRRTVAKMFAFEDDRLRTKVAGIEFSNPIGLAAGFDKNGIAIPLLSRLGFGFLEIGSVSAFVSDGNPIRPRLFRLPADEGLMVYYGVPSQGAAAVAARATSFDHSVPVGINLVETNRGTDSPVEHIIAELTQAARNFVRKADYLVLNLNCPNSGGGASSFDEPPNFNLLLESLCDVTALPPVFLKITPPRHPATTERILATVDRFSFLKGFILNTHVPKPYVGFNTPRAELDRMHGSVTGSRLRSPVNDAIRGWYRRIDRSRHVLIGVGGIGSAEDAYQTIRLGASLVQILTALVYRGPGLVKQLKQDLARLLERDGVCNVADVIGVDACP